MKLWYRSGTINDFPRRGGAADLLFQGTSGYTEIIVIDNKKTGDF